MLTYRGDKFVKGKKFNVNEQLCRFSRRDGDKLIFEAISDGSKISITEEEYNKAEKMLTEKINQENKEINEIIGKVLRSKGLARKYEDQLKSKGITINYDSPQGVTLVGPNGKTLGASSKEVFGPHTPDNAKDIYDSKGYNRAADGHRKTRAIKSDYYDKQVEETQKELDSLKSLKRDDIIRKYNDKTTKEALQAHKDKIASLEKDLEDYTAKAKREERSYQYNLKASKATRRNAEYDSLRKNTEKTQADEHIDYLNYLTKPANEYMDKIRSIYKGYGERPKSNPAAYVKTDKNSIDDYRSLKNNVRDAKRDLDFHTADDNSNTYKSSYAAMTDEQLEAKIKKMRDDLEKKIEELRNNNKANSSKRDEYAKALEDKEKALDDFLRSKGIREADLVEVKNYLKESSTDTQYFEKEIRRVYDEILTLAQEAEHAGLSNLSKSLDNILDVLDEYDFVQDNVIYDK